MVDFTNFYSITITIAIIILILALAFVGWTMSKGKEIVSFPPLKNTCPDNWSVDASSGHCVQPSSDAINYGKQMPPTTPGLDGTNFDPNHAGWSAAGNAVCAKKKWASDLNISWDTVTNANYC